MNKILVLGSGALKIGEAGEFDYSGSQAIKALKEEGIQTVLVNPNIATIQTSKLLADKVYFLPVNDYFVTKVIEKEKPDGIFLAFGGQTALNCGINLYKKGILKKYGVQIYGTPISAIIKTEDREEFASHLKNIKVPIPESYSATNEKTAYEIIKKIGYPVMIRAGYALGGDKSGVAHNIQEFEKIISYAFSSTKQVLIERYLHHFKEIEYEVVRDKYDNCVTVCNMENMDPLGIHTGESIVVAPSQTLTNYEYHFLRKKAIEIVRSLGIVGECNVQYALNPNPSLSFRPSETSGGISFERDPCATAKAEGGTRSTNARDDNSLIDYYVIEINARLSRSSALASKATGYPLAYVAAKLALGKGLVEIKNQVTQITQSFFEPAMDYLVVKIPRWDLEKFKGAEERIGSSMKSVGEVMAIGRNFEEAIQKAVRMLDKGYNGVTDEVKFKDQEELLHYLKVPTPKRIFALTAAIKSGITVEEIYTLTGIDPWFLYRIKAIVEAETKIVETIHESSLHKKSLLHLKQLGFSDKKIGQLVGKTELEIRQLRKKHKITPSVFQIDTLAGEFPARTNYLYFTYNGSHYDVAPLKKEGIMVLGSGPYRIGSSVEFDWTSVNTANALRKYNKKSIIVNCNPETVSTDYDISDRLYFEEITFERVLDIYEFEKSHGVIVSVGGQTPNNIVKSLFKEKVKILGTSPINIDQAEDRSKFSKLLDTLHIDQPSWSKFTTFEEVQRFSKKVGYPLLIRPSYVLSGAAMNTCFDEEELKDFLEKAVIISSEYPITVSKFFLDTKEVEFDAVAEHGKIKVYALSEHIEHAGVHSGDASIVYPAQKLYLRTEKKIIEIGEKLAKALKITGPFNIQFLTQENKVYVIEINLRASRTFPFISKVAGVNFAEKLVDAFFGKCKKVDIPYFDYVAVKVPQFSFSRLTGADPILRVEMASTGEVACFGDDVESAFLKGELSVGATWPIKGIFISLGGDENKIRFLESALRLKKLNLPIYATENTAKFLSKNGLETKILHKIYEKKEPNVLTGFRKGLIDLAINIPQLKQGRDVTDSSLIRRAVVEHNIYLVNNRQKAELFIKAITEKKESDLQIKEWGEYI